MIHGVTVLTMNLPLPTAQRTCYTSECDGRRDADSLADHPASLRRRQLPPLVYDEFRKLAAAKDGRGKTRGRRWRPRRGSTRRTLGWWTSEHVQAWDGRGHFFAAAAEAMRRILGGTGVLNCSTARSTG